MLVGEAPRKGSYMWKSRLEPSVFMEASDYDCSRVAPQDKMPAKASKYITWLHRIIRRRRRKGVWTIRVVLYVRVSSYRQQRCENLEHQLAELRRRVKLLAKWLRVEIQIVDEFTEDESAWKLWKSGRPELVKAAKLAVSKKAVLVATSTFRFVRNRHHLRGVLPTVQDFEKLRELVGKARLATLHDPDAPPKQIRSAETRRGHEARGARPGRPPKPGFKKRIKERNLHKVLDLSQERKSLRQIEAETGINHRTAGRWIEEERRKL